MTLPEALADAHLQAAKHWKAAADNAEQEGNTDRARLYRERAAENERLAQQP